MSAFVPRDLLIGPDNDLVVGKDLALSVGIDGVAQACRIAVQLFEEEWFLNLDVGVPYLQTILGQRATIGIAAAKAAFRRELAAVAGVVAIPLLDVAYDSATRTLTVTWQVRTVLGDTPADSISLFASGAQ